MLNKNPRKGAVKAVLRPIRGHDSLLIKGYCGLLKLIDP